jgi:hypothetical protein
MVAYCNRTSKGVSAQEVRPIQEAFRAWVDPRRRSHTIRFALNELPEEPYPETLWDKKVDAVWAYVFSRGQQAGEHRV